MSRGDRWYIFATGPDGRYDIEGWGKNREAVNGRIDKLDGQGRGPAFKVWAKDRPEARASAVACFEVAAKAGVVGYISPEDRRIGRIIVKSAVMRAIFCPFTNVVLDMRRAVVIVTPTTQAVMVATKWDEVKAEFFAGLRPEQRATVDVYDGRELFKRG